MSVVGGGLHVLLARRFDGLQSGKWALPGGFVRIDESVDDAAKRVLREKAAMAGFYMEQLYTFGDVDRDPRGRVVSVAYFALLDAGKFRDVVIHSEELALACLEECAKESLAVRSSAGKILPLAFDHATILKLALHRLRGKLDYSDLGLALLPEQFTLRQLQEVHEAILGHPLSKPAFRRRMLDKGWIEATGQREPAGAFRPAELYSRKRRGANLYP